MKDKYFTYCYESGFDTHETIEGAIEDANERIPNYLGDGWSEDVTSVCVGKITHRAKICDQVFPDGEIDEDGIDEAGEYWDSDYECKCNYKMLPVEQNPAPDVAKLIRLLDSARLYVVDVLKDPYSSVSHAFAKADLDQIDAAITAYHQQGGSK